MEGEKMFIQVHKIEMCQNRNVAIEEEKLIIEKNKFKDRANGKTAREIEMKQCNCWNRKQKKKWCMEECTLKTRGVRSRKNQRVVEQRKWCKNNEIKRKQQKAWSNSCMKCALKRT